MQGQFCRKRRFNKLQEYPIKALFAGCESGVELADQLSEKLGLLTNGTKMSSARRNKYDMHKVLEDIGIRSLRQIKSSVLDDILQWRKKNSFNKIVLKPLNSGGTDSVIICENEDKINKAFRDILGKRNQLGFLNNEVLAQEFIDGEEHVVNTVSCEGNHFIICVLKYTKQLSGQGSNIYDRDDF